VADRVLHVGRRNGSSPPLLRVLRNLFSDALHLAVVELDLVRARFSRTVKQTVVAAAIVLGAATIGFLGAIGFAVAAGLALAIVVPGWAAALIVAGLLTAVAGGAAFVGVTAFRSASHSRSVGPPELETDLQETRFRLDADLEALSAKLDPLHRFREKAPGGTNGRHGV
jgi:Putative Actinobacterial Holin-X, holin superfamily III